MAWPVPPGHGTSDLDWRAVFRIAPREVGGERLPKLLGTHHDAASHSGEVDGFYSLPGYRCHTLEGASKPSLTLNRIANPEYRSWLDFGCGWGALAQAARERGYDARGVEVGDLARSSLRQRGLAAYANLSECRASGFRPDVVSLIHTLEHLADPRELLREIHSTMNPQGSLIVEVPNLKSLRARAGVLLPKNRYPDSIWASISGLLHDRARQRRSSPPAPPTCSAGRGWRNIPISLIDQIGQFSMSVSACSHQLSLPGVGGQGL